MALRKASRGNKGFTQHQFSSKTGAGFTMIEVLIATAIITVLAGFGLVMTMGFYRSYAFRYETNLVISVLEKARSRAMANIGSDPLIGPRPHGVHFDDTSHMYILFEDQAPAGFDPSDPMEDIPGSKAITVIWPSDDPIFDQLSGNCTTCSSPLEISLQFEGKNATTTINSEGAILW